MSTPSPAPATGAAPVHPWLDPGPVGQTGGASAGVGGDGHTGGGPIQHTGGGPTQHTGGRSRTGLTGLPTGTGLDTVRAHTLTWLQKAWKALGMQPPGWCLLGLVVVLAIAGGNLGWLELRVAAVVGGVVLLCAIGFTLGRQSYQVTLRMQRRQVVVGDRALGDLIVENTSQRRLLPARIELPVGRRLASFGLPSLAGRASHVEVFAVPTSRRAVIRIGPARSVRGDPFGLMGREIRWTETLELYVHPRTVPIPGRTGGFIRDLEGWTTSELTNSDVSFHALREYVAGDDRRYVHWKSTARTGTLMVRQFEETRRSHVAVALDLERTAYATPEEFELAVSVAGSLAVQAIRDENEVAVLTSSGRLRAVSARRALDELCTVETAVTPRGRRAAAARELGIVRLSRSVEQAEPNASLVSLVTGSVPEQASIRQAGTTWGPDVRVLAVRVELGAELTVQTIAAMSVITIGRLEDLPRGVRKASASGGSRRSAATAPVAATGAPA